MEKITVIIADDHALYRAGLRMLLNKYQNIKVVAEAKNGEELVELCKIHEPDVVITDLIMPVKDGIEASKELFKNGFKKIIVLSTYDSDYYLSEALYAGAMGYVLKNAQDGEIIEAITTVYNETRYYCDTVSASVIRLVDKSPFNPHTREAQLLFDERDKEIIRLICEEKSSVEIAKTMFMSKRTIDAIRARIIARMDVKGIAGLAVYAIKNFIYLLKPGRDAANENNSSKHSRIS